MQTPTCTRRIQFAAGHRVLGHENKCANVHGHNYVVLFEARPDLNSLDRIGRVIDFSVLKEKLGGWIDKFWDHGMILNNQDTALIAALNPITAYDTGGGFMRVTKMHTVPFNPTAEEMAEYLLRSVGPVELHGTGVHLTAVTVWETENCYATARL